MARIIAQSGNFTGSSDMTITGFTNATGVFVATWDTSSMELVTEDPTIFTFNIKVDVFPYYLNQEFTYNITVIPTSSHTGTTTPAGPFYTQWWFYVVSAGGVVVVILLVFLLKRKQ